MSRGLRSERRLKTLPDDTLLTASTPYLISVDHQRVVSLNLGNAHAVVETWSRPCVRITPNMYFQSYVELLNEQNLILFDYESYLEQYPFTSIWAGFNVEVPDSTALIVNSQQCLLQDCTVFAIQSAHVELKNCTLMDNFNFTGEFISVQYSTIGRNVSFNARTTVLRHSTCVTLLLNGNREFDDMSVELKNVRGRGVRVGSQRLNRIDAHLHHVRLNRFVMEAGAEGGSITLEGGRIERMDNYSSIPIMKSVLGYRQKCGSEAQPTVSSA